jgi:hypothetical protein
VLLRIQSDRCEMPRACCKSSQTPALGSSRVANRPKGGCIVVFTPGMESDLGGAIGLHPGRPESTRVDVTQERGLSASHDCSRLWGDHGPLEGVRPQSSSVSGPRRAAGPAEIRTTAAVSAPLRPRQCGARAWTGERCPRVMVRCVERLDVARRLSPVSQSGFRNASAQPATEKMVERVRESDGDRVTGRDRSRDTNRRRPDHVPGR